MTSDSGTAEGARIATLDILRGVAVMGILAMNAVDFALPSQAYVNPAAWGAPSDVDLASWAFGFILFDGKMRGLFSLLFGASMLLVIERADARGEPSETIHARRMLWLGVIGLLHFYLIWRGDILFGYAVAGMIAWFFHTFEPSRLVRFAIGFLLVDLTLGALDAFAFFQAEAAASLPGASSEALANWRAARRDYLVPSGDALAATLELFRGPWLGLVEYRMTVLGSDPFQGLLRYSWEAIAYMLAGMAALKTGFLSGRWAPGDYRRVAAIGLGIGLPLHAMLAWIIFDSGFDPAMLIALGDVSATLLRPLVVAGLAALVILLAARRGPLSARIAAAGRAAFTNYLATSIVMTSLFYGHGAGLYGRLGRAELWLVVLPLWVLMLLWSKPWLDRYRYGPFEWLWRTLARGARQPMRKP